MGLILWIAALFTLAIVSYLFAPEERPVRASRVGSWAPLSY